MGSAPARAAAAMTRHDGMFPARMDAFPRVAALVGEAAVAHGHGTDSEAPVRLTLDSQRGRVAVTYEDTGPPFDPLGREETRAAPADPATLRPGGFGLVLVRRLGRELAYARVADRNRLTLVIERAGTS